MIIHLYSCCYNEKDLLPYYLRYYEKVVDKIIVYDNLSNDGSVDILKSHDKVELKSFETDGVNDVVMTHIYNTAYKESDADWVVCADIDEFLVSTRVNLRDTLQEMYDNGVIIPKIISYQMISENFIVSDEQIYNVVKTGVRDPVYDKTAIFRGDVDINYFYGRHSAKPKYNGYLLSSYEGIMLFHYKFFGRQRYLNKQKELRNRVSEINQSNEYGLFLDEQKAGEFFDYTLNCATDVLD